MQRIERVLASPLVVDELLINVSIVRFTSDQSNTRHVQTGIIYAAAMPAMPYYHLYFVNSQRQVELQKGNENNRRKSIGARCVDLHGRNMDATFVQFGLRERILQISGLATA
jgi:hypothetical protein